MDKQTYKKLTGGNFVFRMAIGVVGTVVLVMAGALITDITR